LHEVLVWKMRVTRSMREDGMPLMPGVFPDYPAPYRDQ
jgi:hypothetical protein